MRRQIALGVAVVLAAVASPARAQTHQHDGLFLRFLAGAGHTSARATASGVDAYMGGTGYVLGFALGGTVLPNLVVFAEIIESAAVNPDVEVEGYPPLMAQADMGAEGLGVGASYYFPANFYLSATLAASRMVALDKDGDDIGNTKLGPGLSLAVGKEWWVSDNWGLGVALHAYLVRTRDRRPTFAPGTPLWDIRGFNLAFSATFN